MDLDQTIGQLAHVVAALSPLYPYLLPVLLPLVVPPIMGLVGRVIHGDMAKASAAVTRAGLIASTRFSQVLAEELAKARAPESPGGVAVTDAERKAAMTTAGAAAASEALTPEVRQRAVNFVVEEALDRMNEKGELANAVKAYDGDLSLVRDSIRAQIKA